MTDLETLWETHDFALTKVVMLEDEYNFLINQVHDFFEQEISGEAVFPISKDELLSQFEKIDVDLNNYYNKQLTTIKEIEDFHNSNPHAVPPDREVSRASFKELKAVTANLRDSLKESTEEIKIVLTSSD
jgi:hypothetical protein